MFSKIRRWFRTYWQNRQAYKAFSAFLKYGANKVQEGMPVDEIVEKYVKISCFDADGNRLEEEEENMVSIIRDYLTKYAADWNKYLEASAKYKG
jgi:hypothetical protein